MVPPEVGNLFMVLTGEKWPQIDEDELLRLGEAWKRASGRLQNELRPEIAAVVKKLREEFRGKAANRFADRMAPLLDSPSPFDAVGESFQGSADFLRQMSLQTEYVKLVTILSLIELLVEIAWAIAMSGPTFGASMTWLAGRFAIMRFLMKNIWGRLIMRLVQAQVFGILAQVAIDAGAQLIQIAKGSKDFSEWDKNSTVQAVQVGALGGAMALPLSALGGALGNIFSKVLTDKLGNQVDKQILKAAADAAADKYAKELPNAKSLADFATKISDHMNTHVGKDLGAHTPGNFAGMSLKGMYAHKAGRALGDVLEESLHEWLTEATYNATQGQGFQASGFAATAGAASSISEKVGSFIGDGIHGNLKPGDGENPFLAEANGSGKDSDSDSDGASTISGDSGGDSDSTTSYGDSGFGDSDDQASVDTAITTPETSPPASGGTDGPKADSGGGGGTVTVGSNGQTTGTGGSNPAGGPPNSSVPGGSSPGGDRGNPGTGDGQPAGSSPGSSGQGSQNDGPASGQPVSGPGSQQGGPADGSTGTPGQGPGSGQPSTGPGGLGTPDASVPDSPAPTPGNGPVDSPEVQVSPGGTVVDQPGTNPSIQDAPTTNGPGSVTTAPNSGGTPSTTPQGGNDAAPVDGTPNTTQSGDSGTQQPSTNVNPVPGSPNGNQPAPNPPASDSPATTPAPGSGNTVQQPGTDTNSQPGTNDQPGINSRPDANTNDQAGTNDQPGTNDQGGSYHQPGSTVQPSGNVQPGGSAQPGTNTQQPGSNAQPGTGGNTSQAGNTPTTSTTGNTPAPQSTTNTPGGTPKSPDTTVTPGKGPQRLGDISVTASTKAPSTPPKTNPGTETANVEAQVGSDGRPVDQKQTPEPGESKSETPDNDDTSSIDDIITPAEAPPDNNPVQTPAEAPRDTPGSRSSDNHVATWSVDQGDQGKLDLSHYVHGAKHKFDFGNGVKESYDVDNDWTNNRDQQGRDSLARGAQKIRNGRGLSLPDVLWYRLKARDVSANQSLLDGIMDAVADKPKDSTWRPDRIGEGVDLAGKIDAKDPDQRRVVSHFTSLRGTIAAREAVMQQLNVQQIQLRTGKGPNQKTETINIDWNQIRQAVRLRVLDELGRNQEPGGPPGRRPGRTPPSHPDVGPRMTREFLPDAFRADPGFKRLGDLELVDTTGQSGKFFQSSNNRGEILDGRADQLTHAWNHLRFLAWMEWRSLHELLNSGDAGDVLEDPGAYSQRSRENTDDQAQTPAAAPPQSGPVPDKSNVPSTPGGKRFISPEEWGDRRDTAPKAVVNEFSFEPIKEGAGKGRAAEPIFAGGRLRGIDGLGLLPGRNTYINVEIRRFQAPNGDWVREYTIKADLVSKKDALSAEQRREVGDRLRDVVDTYINQKYRLRGGDQLHLTVDFGTPKWDDRSKSWDVDSKQRPPVEVHDSKGGANQLRWGTEDDSLVLLHELMHFLGLKDAYESPDTVLDREETKGKKEAGRQQKAFTEDDERALGLMGPRFRENPVLTDENLDRLEEISRSGGVLHDHPLDAPSANRPDPTPRPARTNSEDPLGNPVQTPAEVGPPAAWAGEQHVATWSVDQGGQGKLELSHYVHGAQHRFVFGNGIEERYDVDRDWTNNRDPENRDSLDRGAQNIRNTRGIGVPDVLWYRLTTNQISADHSLLDGIIDAVAGLPKDASWQPNRMEGSVDLVGRYDPGDADQRRLVAHLAALRATIATREAVMKQLNVSDIEVQTKNGPENIRIDWDRIRQTVRLKVLDELSHHPEPGGSSGRRPGRVPPSSNDVGPRMTREFLPDLIKSDAGFKRLDELGLIDKTGQSGRHFQAGSGPNKVPGGRADQLTHAWNHLRFLGWMEWRSLHELLNNGDAGDVLETRAEYADRRSGNDSTQPADIVTPAEAPPDRPPTTQHEQTEETGNPPADTRDFGLPEPPSAADSFVAEMLGNFPDSSEVSSDTSPESQTSPVDDAVTVDPSEQQQEQPEATGNPPANARDFGLPLPSRVADSFASEIQSHRQDTRLPAELVRDGIISQQARLLPSDGVWSGENGKVDDALIDNLTDKIGIPADLRAQVAERLRDHAEQRGGVFGLLQSLSGGRTFQIDTGDGPRDLFLQLDRDVVRPGQEDPGREPHQRAKQETSNKQTSSGMVSRKMKFGIVAGFWDAAIDAGATMLNMRALPFVAWSGSRSQTLKDGRWAVRERTAKLGKRDQIFDVNFQLRYQLGGQQPGSTRFDPTVRLAYPESMLETPGQDNRAETTDTNTTRTPVSMPVEAQQLIANVDSYANVGGLQRNVLATLPDWVRQDATLSGNISTSIDSPLFVEETAEGLVNGVDITHRTIYPKALSRPSRSWSKHPEVKLHVTPKLRGFERVGGVRGDVGTGETWRRTKDGKLSKSTSSGAETGIRLRFLPQVGELEVDGHKSPFRVGPLAQFSFSSTRQESYANRSGGKSKDKSVEREGVQRYRLDLSLGAEFTARPGGKGTPAPVEVDPSDGAAYVWVRDEDTAEFEAALNKALGTPSVQPPAAHRDPVSDPAERRRIRRVIDGDGMFKDPVRLHGAEQLREQARQHIQRRLAEDGVELDDAGWAEVDEQLKGFAPHKLLTKFDALSRDTGTPHHVEVQAGGRKFDFDVTNALGDVTGRRGLDKDVQFSATRSRGGGWKNGVSGTFGWGAFASVWARTTARASGGYGASTYLGGVIGAGVRGEHGKGSGHGTGTESEVRLKYTGKADRVRRAVSFDMNVTETTPRDIWHGVFRESKSEPTPIRVDGEVDYRVARFLLDSDQNRTDQNNTGRPRITGESRVDMRDAAVVSIPDLYSQANEAFHEVQRNAALAAKDGRYERARRQLAEAKDAVSDAFARYYDKAGDAFRSMWHGHTYGEPGETRQRPEPRNHDPKYKMDLDPEWWQTNLAGMFHRTQVRDDGGRAGMIFDRMQRGGVEMEVHNERSLGQVEGDGLWENTTKTEPSVSDEKNSGLSGEASAQFIYGVGDVTAGYGARASEGREATLGGTTKSSSARQTPLELFTGDLVVRVRADAWQQLFGQPNRKWNAISPYQMGASSESIELVIPGGAKYVRPSTGTGNSPDNTGQQRTGETLPEDLPLLQDIGKGLDKKVTVAKFTADTQRTPGADKLSDRAINALAHAAPELFPGWTPGSGKPAPLYDGTQVLQQLDDEAGLRQVLNGKWDRTLYRSQWFGTNYYSITARAKKADGNAQRLHGDGGKTSGYTESEGSQSVGGSSSRGVGIGLGFSVTPEVPTAPTLLPGVPLGYSKDGGSQQTNDVGEFRQDRSETTDHADVRAPVEIEFTIHKFKTPPLLLSTITEGSAGPSRYRHPESREVALPPELKSVRGTVDLNVPEYLLEQSPTAEGPRTQNDITDAARNTKSFHASKALRNDRMSTGLIDAIADARSGHKDLVRRWFGEGTPNRAKVDALFSPDMLVSNIGHDRPYLKENGYTTKFQIHDRFLSVDYEVQLKPRLTDPRFRDEWHEKTHTIKDGANVSESNADTNDRGGSAGMGFAVFAANAVTYAGPESGLARGDATSEGMSNGTQSGHSTKTKNDTWRRYDAVPEFDLVIRSKLHFVPGWSEHRVEGDDALVGSRMEFDVKKAESAPFDEVAAQENTGTQRETTDTRREDTDTRQEDTGVRRETPGDSRQNRDPRRTLPTIPEESEQLPDLESDDFRDDSTPRPPDADVERAETDDPRDDRHQDTGDGLHPVVAAWPAAEVKAGTTVYHATSAHSAGYIIESGIRSAPDPTAVPAGVAGNEWGGGELGLGFYTHTSKESAENYVWDDDRRVTLQYETTQDLRGRFRPEWVPWIGDVKGMDYRRGVDAILNPTNPGEIKFHTGRDHLELKYFWFEGQAYTPDKFEARVLNHDRRVEADTPQATEHTSQHDNRTSGHDSSVQVPAVASRDSVVVPVQDGQAVSVDSVPTNGDRRVVLVSAFDPGSQPVRFETTGSRLAADLGREVVALVDNGRGRTQWRSFPADGSRSRVVPPDAMTSVLAESLLPSTTRPEPVETHTAVPTHRLPAITESVAVVPLPDGQPVSSDMVRNLADPAAERIVLLSPQAPETQPASFAESGAKLASDLGKEVVALVGNGRGRNQWRAFPPDGSRSQVVPADGMADVPATSVALDHSERRGPTTPEDEGSPGPSYESWREQYDRLSSWAEKGKTADVPLPLARAIAHQAGVKHLSLGPEDAAARAQYERDLAMIDRVRREQGDRAALEFARGLKEFTDRYPKPAGGLLGGVKHDLLVPEDLDRGIVEVQPGAVFRFLDTEPAVALADGLVPKEPENVRPLETHVGTTGRTQFVSTTYDSELNYKRRPYRYKIVPSETGIDVAETFQRWGVNYSFKWEQEVAFTGTIPPADIVEIRNNETGEVVWHRPPPPLAADALMPESGIDEDQARDLVEDAVRADIRSGPTTAESLAASYEITPGRARELIEEVAAGEVRAAAEAGRPFHHD
ncbi:WXG100-like domain-containing protein [Saccharopolyspora sp. NPDC003752]